MARFSVLGSSRSALVSSVLVSLAWSFTLGCSSGAGGEDDRKVAQTATGTAGLPLVTTANGNVYRLSNASLIVCGTACTYLSSSDAPGETMLSTTLATGYYQASLQYWSLQKRDADGVFQPVRANLLSNPTTFFQVFDGTTTTISYQFESDGVIVTVGQGILNVDLGVTEIPSACTALGNDCAEGSWCPPAELTGNPLACLSAGNVALGEPCSTATSCVANASCFDIGAGPVCVALCAEDAFGGPCPSGGTCEAAGTTYGLCR